jgi:hypothetical protein
VGVFNLGFLTNFLSHSVIGGFTSGAAISESVSMLISHAWVCIEGDVTGQDRVCQCLLAQNHPCQPNNTVTTQSAVPQKHVPAACCLRQLVSVAVWIQGVAAAVSAPVQPCSAIVVTSSDSAACAACSVCPLPQSLGCHRCVCVSHSHHM